MKLSHLILGFAAFGQGISAAAIHDAQDGALVARSPESQNPDQSTNNEELWKRKGGGGSGGRGGSGSSGGSSSGSSGSSGGRGSSGSTSGGRGSSSSNTGGSTTTGSGVRPGYGGGTYYGGGAKQPYRSGTTSPSGIVPFVLAGTALGTLGFIGATWAYGAYVYPYTHHYYYHNTTNNQNETKPVTCLCDYYEVCGCDDNGNQTYFNSVIGDGSYAGLNRSLVTVADNTTTNESTIYIKGSLPNGTTSSGGTESPNAAGGDLVTLARAVGWWPVVTTAIAIAFI
ncbi:uncharacterized protein F4807DRAFT_427366 [Annulohypoxylon truncatum]|uniref:uncharacterized protein n=1 Tax=Annulohypoxylon truncatum TaxID=327061 RepID=UPI002008585A|nr:uncharacterized protein F4807DRAFT_427366 [Annulohypoxylon truncatum]KAI1209149.1 hypothetical protein F4807DRAFT_427366 [Annulohypoxylon truncatum]